jgi:hypothetical protein
MTLFRLRSTLYTEACPAAYSMAYVPALRAALEAALSAPPAPPAEAAVLTQDAGPKARHWKQAIFNFFGHPFDVTNNECDRIEQDARALAAKEAGPMARQS